MNKPNRTRGHLVAFLLGLAGFGLPFVEVSCQQQVVQTLKGHEVVVGKMINRPDRLMGHTVQEFRPGLPEFRICAGLLCIALVAAFPRDRAARGLSAAIGAGALITLWIAKSSLEGQLQRMAGGMAQFRWLMGFWLLNAGLLLGILSALYEEYQTRLAGAGPREPEALDSNHSSK